MNKPPTKHRKQIDDTWVELVACEGIINTTSQRIEDCRALIRANANFLPDAERTMELMLLDVFKRPTNITEAVRLTLFMSMARGGRVTPTQIKKQIEARGFSLSDYTNPLASIHTILRRMKDADPPEVDYDDKSDSFAPTKYPASGLYSEEFTGKIAEKVKARLLKFDEQLAKEESGKILGEATEAIMNSVLDRKKLTGD